MKPFGKDPNSTSAEADAAAADMLLRYTSLRAAMTQQKFSNFIRNGLEMILKLRWLDDLRIFNFYHSRGPYLKNPRFKHKLKHSLQHYF